MQTGPSILVVDDDPVIRMLTLRILEAADFQVSAAGTSNEVISIIEADVVPFDLILLDNQLDERSGMDLVDLIRARIPRMPIILSSGETVDLDLLPAHLKSLTYFLPKPYPSLQLTGMIEEALIAAGRA